MTDPIPATVVETPQILASSRPTIMSGEVVTFALGFKEDRGALGGMGYNATGPFEVSASRDAVVVHHAHIRYEDDAGHLIAAIAAARVLAGHIDQEDPPCPVTPSPSPTRRKGSSVTSMRFNSCGRPITA